jgi:hypothetical protein
MAKNKKEGNKSVSSIIEKTATAETGIDTADKAKTGFLGYLKIHVWASVAILVLTLLALAGGLKYLEEDPQREMAKNSKDRSLLSSINPFMPTPTPTPTPQLSKEYIYAGSRLLAVEDAGASAIPPADLAVWRPSDGYWYVMGGTGSAQTFQQWGSSADQPAPGDYDGDGKTDFAIYRGSEGNWYIIPSSTGSYYAVAQGANGDKPVPGDYDGDGKTDTALFRSSNATWYVKKSSDSTSYSQAFGISTDKTAQGDFDGDGKTDPTVWRPGDKTFYALRSSDGYWFSVQVGSTGTDLPVPCDYDGDGTGDMAVLSGNSWIIRNSSTGSIPTPIAWQNAGDIPVQNDYDGDGKCDIAGWRNSTGDWYIRKSASSGALRLEHWGQSGDIPVPALYRR